MALKKPYRGFTYLPHQEEGVRWMLQRENADAQFCCGGILADDMGLGKTWQGIGLLKNAPMDTTLLVAPPVLIAQWMDALTKSRIPNCQLLNGRWIGDADAAVFLTTYDRLWRSQDVVEQTVWDRIMLDEGHAIRNGPKTRRFRALSALRGRRKWILSGTPVQNSQSDFRFLATWLECDLESASLRKVAAAIILRRSITLLADDMPAPPEHVRHELPFLGTHEHEFFSALVGRLEHAVENNFPARCILELYLRIQMFSSHPQIYVEAMRRKYGQLYIRDDWQHSSTKMDAFRDVIARSKEPTLAFCHFKLEMDYCAAAARKLGYRVFFVRGGHTESARTAQIEESRSAVADGEHVLLICQIVAANCGLNLQHLTRVVFYTQHWNPAVIDQALTRSYRYGQTSNVKVHHLIIGSDELLNIDHKMLQKHATKRAAAKDLLSSLEFAYHPNFVVAPPRAESPAAATVDEEPREFDAEDPQ